LWSRRFRPSKTYAGFGLSRRQWAQTRTMTIANPHRRTKSNNAAKKNQHA
jgi:hypothetical protein